MCGGLRRLRQTVMGTYELDAAALRTPSTISHIAVTYGPTPARALDNPELS
jgi:hypothetical protein